MLREIKHGQDDNNMFLKMGSYGFFDSEKVQCVHWSAEIHECTAI